MKVSKCVAKTLKRIIMISVQALFELQTDTFIIISAFSEFPYQKNVHTNQIDSVARRENSRMHKPLTASMIIIINANRLHEGRKKKPKKSVLHPSVASFFISHTLSLALFSYDFFVRFFTCCHFRMKQKRQQLEIKLTNRVSLWKLRLEEKRNETRTNESVNGMVNLGEKFIKTAINERITKCFG